MENHPIPQDVTGFQFRLIGDMTIKQFAYLAGGAALAWVFWSILPISPFIKVPLCGIIAATGAAMAFLPISGRPLDVMMTNFFKALINPSQYIFHKTGGQLAFDAIQIVPTSAQKKQAIQAKQTARQTNTAQQKNLAAYLQTISNSSSNNSLDQKELAFMQTVTAGFTPAASSVKPFARAEQFVAPMQPVPTPVIPPPAPIVQPQIPVQPAPMVHPAAPVPVAAPAPTPPQPTPIQSFQPIQAQVVQQPITPMPDNQTVRKIEIQPRKVVNPITPDVPNLVTGIVKDPRGNVLPNILVEVKDTEGNPIRAFKTNGFGQFASATPLNPAVYTIEFEDPKGVNKFDSLEIQINGSIITPLEIVSSDAREELRKALFT